MGDFANLLRVVKAGDNANEKSYWMKRLSKGAHELMQVYNISAEHLVREELYKEILRGAEEVLCMRDVLPIYRMKKNELRFVLTDAPTGMLPLVAPGSSLPEGPDVHFKSDVTFVAQKYGEKVGIPEELIEEEEFDIIELLVHNEGRRAENRLNDVAMKALLDAKSSVESTDNVSIIDRIVEMIKTMRGNKFEPDTIIMTPDAEAEILKYMVGETKSANTTGTTGYQKTGVPEVFRTKDIGRPIVGLKPYVLSKTVTGDSITWGGADTNAHICILDSRMAGGIGMRSDIAVERYEDPLNDLRNLKITMRMCAKVFFDDAIEFGDIDSLL
ncbi:MAG: hypothetical protein ACXQTM_00060 [Methanosarcinales archaeon]